MTGASWPVNVFRGSPVSISQERIVQSRDPVNSISQLFSVARHSTAFSWPANVRTPFAVSMDQSLAVPSLEPRTSRNGISRRHIYGSKIAKITSECQVFSFTVPEKPKSWTELTRQGSPSRFSNIHSVAKYQKLKGGPFKDRKVSHCRKRLKGGNL